MTAAHFCSARAQNNPGALFAIGELVEVHDRAYAPAGVFEVIETEGDRLLIQGPEGHANPMTISIPAAQCEVVF